MGHWVKTDHISQWPTYPPRVPTTPSQDRHLVLSENAPEFEIHVYEAVLQAGYISNQLPYRVPRAQRSPQWIRVEGQAGNEYEKPACPPLERVRTRPQSMMTTILLKQCYQLCGSSCLLA